MSNHSELIDALRAESRDYYDSAEHQKTRDKTAYNMTGVVYQNTAVLLVQAADALAGVASVSPVTVTTSETVRELPVGSVFRGYYYPPTLGLPERDAEKTLASIQMTRGLSIIHGERAEYSLDQPWERIEVLFRPVTDKDEQ